MNRGRGSGPRCCYFNDWLTMSSPTIAWTIVWFMHEDVYDHSTSQLYCYTNGGRSGLLKMDTRLGRFQTDHLTCIVTPRRLQASGYTSAQASSFFQWDLPWRHF